MVRLTCLQVSNLLDAAKQKQEFDPYQSFDEFLEEHAKYEEGEDENEE